MDSIICIILYNLCPQIHVLFTQLGQWRSKHPIPLLNHWIKFPIFTKSKRPVKPIFFFFSLQQRSFHILTGKLRRRNPHLQGHLGLCFLLLDILYINADLWIVYYVYHMCSPQYNSDDVGLLVGLGLKCFPRCEKCEIYRTPDVRYFSHC